jgi:hypothetical protein
MISEIIQIVQSDKWYNVSQRIEFAKGDNKYMTKWSQVWNEIKRILKWRKK